MENHAIRRFALAIALALAAGLVLNLINSLARAADGPTVQPYHGLSPAQRADLRNVGRDTWRFYSVDIDCGVRKFGRTAKNIQFAGRTNLRTPQG
jgi:hypothetical protein